MEGRGESKSGRNGGTESVSSRMKMNEGKKSDNEEDSGSEREKKRQAK